MPEIPIVVNPKRRRRKPRRSKKGRFVSMPKKRRTTRRRPRKTTRRRRNPTLARVRNARRRPTRRTYRRRRRNPGKKMFGFLDIKAAMFVGAGAIGVRMMPGFLAKVVPQVPTTGIGGLAVKAGSAALLGYAANMITTRANAAQVANGAMAMVLVEVFNQYVAPQIGLGGFVRRPGWDVGGSTRMAGLVRRPYSPGGSTRLSAASASPAMLTRTAMSEYAY